MSVKGRKQSRHKSATVCDITEQCIVEARSFVMQQRQVEDTVWKSWADSMPGLFQRPNHKNAQKRNNQASNDSESMPMHSGQVIAEVSTKWWLVKAKQKETENFRFWHTPHKEPFTLSVTRFRKPNVELRWLAVDTESYRGRKQL